MYCAPDKHIRLEYCVHDSHLHIADITDPRYEGSPALINKIQDTVACDFVPYAYRMMAKYNYKLPYAKMKELFTQWLAKYMMRKKKWPVISEYYKLLYNERERCFKIRNQKEDNINSSWRLIANRVHLDTIMEFIENAQYVFYDHTAYYPDAAAVRYALQMWIAHHAEQSI
ncbi:MAG: hypothetical protein JSS76_19530 [Bacteroidetes bacterium]|nr:hypothetical protein [Bacteroidota bacterium]